MQLPASAQTDLRSAKWPRRCSCQPVEEPHADEDQAEQHEARSREGKKATFFAKRTTKGRFKEMDGRGRSLAADRRRAAKRTTKSGHGDQGDRRKRRAA